jgi:hypothetical protein
MKFLSYLLGFSVRPSNSVMLDTFSSPNRIVLLLSDTNQVNLNCKDGIEIVPAIRLRHLKAAKKKWDKQVHAIEKALKKLKKMDRVCVTNDYRYDGESGAAITKALIETLKSRGYDAYIGSEYQMGEVFHISVPSTLNPSLELLK